jgi:hypothetical protein
VTFSCGALDQRTVDLNLRGEGVIGTDAFSIAGRTRISPSIVEPTAVNIVFLGQSINNNSVSGPAPTIFEPYVPLNAANIFNLSIGHRGTLFSAQQPPLLVSDLQLDHHGRMLADSIISAGLAPQVILTMAAFGGSYCADWAPGGGTCGGADGGGTTRTGLLSYRIGLAQRCICAAGLDSLPTIIDWQQGTWDSDAPATTQAEYTVSLLAVIAECERVGLLRTGRVMFVHQETRLTATTANRNAIRAAQADVCDGVLVKLGADIDTIGASYRYDGTHMTMPGGLMQAGLKFPLYAIAL